MPDTPPSAALLIDGTWVSRADCIAVRNPYDGAVVGYVVRGTVSDVDAAIGAAAASLGTSFPAHERYAVLQRAAARLATEAEDYAKLLAQEGHKTIREARRAPVRAADILRFSAEAGRTLAGETLPFDARPGSENRVGYFTRVPVGVIAVIMPFNDPLAVMTHKVGPALAAGNAVVLKPDSKAPLAALRLARALTEAGLPPGRLNVVTGHGAEIGDALVRDPRVRLVAFTGGVPTGERITRTAGLKKLLLELGANAPVLVLEDADLDRAAQAVADGAFAQAGQNCLGVQRVFIHQNVYTAFAQRLADHTAALVAGSSLDEATDVCAMITEAEAERVEAWIQEATAAGATVRVGGKRAGAVVWPTVLEHVPDTARLACNEVYGPVVSLFPVASLDEAIQRANATPFGLHAAVFTESLRDAFHAAERLDAGAVIVNDSTDYRLDLMPFGGMKNSGIGREGIRHALLEMTVPKVVCFNL